jgi:hypothetical protein
VSGLCIILWLYRALLSEFVPGEGYLIIMESRHRAEESPFRRREVKRSHGLLLFALALLAVSAAILLSPSGARVRAWYQSPISPVSPVLTQPLSTPTPSSTVPAKTPTSIPDTPAPSDTEPPQSNGQNTATLMAGGIVLIGLITGAVLLLVRGQPSNESAS